MMKKNYALTLLMLTSMAQAAFATHNKKLFEELSCESKHLTIRPLVPEEYEEAKALDQSDQSFLTLFSDDEEAPSDQENTADRNLDSIKKTCSLLKEKSLSELSTVRQEIPSGDLYFGVFSKEHSALAGAIKFKGLQSDWMEGDETVKHLLGTDVKFHKNTQGKGYASEAYRTVFSHFQTLELIPEHAQEHNNATFLGVHALIHLTNKASLKCLVFNSGSKIGRLFGDRVDVYYPDIPTLKTTEDYLPVPDANLDKDLRPRFTDYLSRDIQKSEPAEKEIYEASFQKFLTLPESHREIALDDESGFFLRALAKFPHFFDLVDPSLLLTFNGMITQMEDSFPPRESVPLELHGKLDEAIECIRKVREKLPRLEKPQSEEENTKENAQEESKQVTLNEVLEPTTSEKQISNVDVKTV